MIINNYKYLLLDRLLLQLTYNTNPTKKFNGYSTYAVYHLIQVQALTTSVQILEDLDWQLLFIEKGV